VALDEARSSGYRWALVLMTLLNWPKELDADALFARVFRPERARLAEAMAVTEGAESPREALERAVARGLCPEDWLDTSSLRGRAFGGKVHSPRRIPQLIETVTALASDAEGVLAAEELAREFLRRAGRMTTVASPEAPLFWRERGGQKLRRRGIFPEGRSVFPPALMLFHDVQFDYRDVDKLLVARDPPPPSPQPTGLRGLLATVRKAFQPQSPYRRPTPHIDEWNGLANRASREHGVGCAQAIDHHRRAWFCAVLGGEKRTLRDLFPNSTLLVAYRREVLDASLSTLPNVFEPLARLWWTGYALRVVNFERIELQLPRLEEGDVARP